MTATYRDLGDGPPCPEVSPAGSRSHGRTYIIARPDGTELCWCPLTLARFALVGGHDAGERLTGLAPVPATAPKRPSQKVT